jgi:hypothetical protein
MTEGFRGKGNLPNVYGDDYNFGFEFIYTAVNASPSGLSTVWLMDWELIHNEGDFANPDVHGLSRTIIDIPGSADGQDRLEDIFSIVSGVDLQDGDIMNYDLYLDTNDEENTFNGDFYMVGFQPVYTKEDVMMSGTDYNRI